MSVTDPMPDPPMFTAPVVGYRRWKMQWMVDVYGELVVVDGPGFYTIQRGADRTMDHEAVPALMPSGWASTGRPWVPGRNDAVCSGRETWPWPNGWSGLGPPPVHAMPLTPRDHPPGRHPAPDPDCKCGLYAMHSIDEAIEALGPLCEGEVLGAVVGWGAIEVHADGWRAEHAMVVALSLDNESFDPRWGLSEASDDALRTWTQRRNHNVRAVAERYGVPAVERQDLHLIAEGHGQSLPENAKPERPVLPPLSFRSTPGNTHYPPSPPQVNWMGHGHPPQGYNRAPVRWTGMGTSTAASVTNTSFPMPAFVTTPASGPGDPYAAFEAAFKAGFERRLRMYGVHPRWDWPFTARLARRVKRMLRIPARRPGWADLGSL